MHGCSVQCVRIFRSVCLFAQRYFLFFLLATSCIVHYYVPLHWRSKRVMEIYHERQSRMLCALHSLNNLFQDRNAFSKSMLDDICGQLNPEALINPHKNMLGLGDYDINVVMAALQLKDYETVWFDKRISPESLKLENVFGFILNKPSSMNLLGIEMPIKRQHWFAIRELGSNFYNLDSKLTAPICIGGHSEMKKFLTDQLCLPQSELLIVVTKETAEKSSWKTS